MIEPNKDKFVCKKTGRIYGYENCTGYLDPDFVPGCKCNDVCVYNVVNNCECGPKILYHYGVQY
jgi:hypothetical protein